ncbi:MAG: class I SAM-dependent methyltransferase [Verrucomicrobia bacterium]|jgi:SAM-dependent methyltransferase|nr:class I SAM-dependent methyltransferase [Verrucomicrobiota bacterium]MBT4276421.1 class I SAM-dependent methyltransferase [Verrucomicrobiota bacterium]MBT5064021.1 class I SAM-dependent methyltransferase [Verrucomicrobiota bacterium]MBT5479472.1 class I SAM-dependent methyltransferase [Verrucomicrobiota bacterium]MBT7534597.1 class I SAM-dependent methyltransferase [Verrucomicrobiota bacterium]
MRQSWSEKLKQSIRPSFYAFFARNKERFKCPICGYQGAFKDKRVSTNPNIIRKSSKCLGCGSTERHRMIHLVLKDVFDQWNPSKKSILHIAPEECLKIELLSKFETYHTADLEREDVDFKEDLQKLSFPESSYDAIMVSRVLTIPPDLKSCLLEIHRVLKKGGIAVIAETYIHEKTLTFEGMRQGRSREIGADFMHQMKSTFDQVDFYKSERYDKAYQLINCMMLDHQPQDAYPNEVRMPGVGFKEVVAICHKHS